MNELPSQPRIVLFVHVPKSAGSTVDDYLKANDPFGHRHAGNVFKGVGGVDARKYRSAQQSAGDPDTRILSGHLPLGVLSLLPDSIDIRCITFLREPIDRAISHYYWQITRKERSKKRASGPLRIFSPDEESPATARASGQITRETPLDEAFSAIHYVADNMQTRFLSGSPYPFGPVDDEMLEAAKENLRTRLLVVGVAERMDESVLLLKRRLGFGAILTERARVNETRPRGADVPAEVREAAERFNRYDTELYRFAVELFDEAMTELDDLEAAVDLGAVALARNGKEVPAPPPDFDGGSEAWELLLRVRADGLRNALVAGRAAYSLREALRETRDWVGRLEARRGKMAPAKGEEVRSKGQRELERLHAEAERVLAHMRQHTRWVRSAMPGEPGD